MGNTSAGAIYTDFQGLAELRSQVRLSAKNELLNGEKNKEDQSTRGVAQQFEALFIQSMLKSMRDASGGESMGDSDQTDLYRDLYDKQIALDLAKRGGIGIADVIERQLNGPNNQQQGAEGDAERTLTIPSRPASDQLAFAARLWSQTPHVSTAPRIANTENTTTITDAPLLWRSAEAFVADLQAPAEAAAKRLGTQPEVIVAIAALETGWGQHVIAVNKEQSSYNLFGIKADSGWQKSQNTDQATRQVTVSTLEYYDGQAQQVQAPFRRYQNVAASVVDFARFIETNPRYQQALSSASDAESFVKQLHKAGYATDPNYSDKVLSVMRQVRQMTQAPMTLADNIR